MSEHSGGHDAYFQAFGFGDTSEAFTQGKFYAEAFGNLGKGLHQALRRNKTLKEYFTRDYQIEHYLQFSEQLSNMVYEHLADEPSGRLLINAMESDPQHGYEHTRRLEKWYKADLKHDKAFRSNPEVLYFSPSAFMGTRFHDIVEVINGIKEGHSEASGLFALGYLLQSRHLANEAVSGFNNEQRNEFPLHDWMKMAWGTAFICIHHTRPEQMPSTEDIMIQGVFNPEELLSLVEKTAKEHHMPIEKYFPPYKLIRETIQKIQDGALEIPVFTKEEIEGLKLQTRLIAAVDKLDSNYPPDLSAVRTFLTKPDRPFFLRIEGALSLEEELQERPLRCRYQEAQCDFDRYLYEITRTQVFEGVSPILSVWYADALREKGVFLDEAISALLNGDGSNFLSPYEHLEKDMTLVILEKIGRNDITIRGNAQRAIDDQNHKFIIHALREKGYSAESYMSLLLRIRGERIKVENIVSKKILSLHQQRVTDKEKERIRALVSLARQQQYRELAWVPGIQKDVEPPYSGYLYVRLEKNE
jgi:hypothetical protein